MEMNPEKRQKTGGGQIFLNLFITFSSFLHFEAVLYNHTQETVAESGMGGVSEKAAAVSLNNEYETFSYTFS
jgi:hypothetical protein